MLTSNWLTITTNMRASHTIAQSHWLYVQTSFLCFGTCATRAIFFSESASRHERASNAHCASRKLQSRRLFYFAFSRFSHSSRLSYCTWIIRTKLGGIAHSERYVRKTTTYRNDIRWNKQFHAMRCRAQKRAKESLKL